MTDSSFDVALSENFDSVVPNKLAAETYVT